MKERVILSIDLKSFFASAECVYRGLDPFTTPLVVADTRRGKGAMSLAVSPYLRNKGIKSRCRVYEIPNNLNIMYVYPRMKLYEEYSKKIINIYRKFISDEDIHIYSIDEVFIDATDYLKYYKMDDITLAKTIMKEIKDKTGITSTCGIGPNIFLSKVAMDIEAKHNKDFIAKWTYKDVENKLWEISPLSEVWGIGKRTEKNLNNLGIQKIKDINKYTREFYIKRFGNVSGNDIWSKANGIDFTTIKDLNKISKNKSISMSQIFYRDYNIEEALLILKEMNDMLNRKLKKMNYTTNIIYISVSYSKDLYKKFSDSISLNTSEDNADEIFKTIAYLYNRNVEDLPIRKVAIVYAKLEPKTATQLSLFDKTDIKETSYNDIVDKITEKYGTTSILRASSLFKSSTIKNREKFKNLI